MQTLSEMIRDASRHKTPDGVCGALLCLNSKGKLAGGDDHIASVVPCNSTEFSKLPDGTQKCKKCWSSKQTKGEDRDVSTSQKQFQTNATD